MAEPYTNTISGLLKRRAELMGEAMTHREQLAVVGTLFRFTTDFGGGALAILPSTSDLL